ncbi:MAG: hypothetical protein ACJA0H_002337 [Francisellaceae bacterium]|jgi:hypothetical protein
MENIIIQVENLMAGGMSIDDAIDEQGLCDYEACSVRDAIDG